MKLQILSVALLATLTIACGKGKNNGENNGDPTPDMGTADVQPDEGGGGDTGPVGDETSIADLSPAQRRAICSEVVEAAGGAQELECGPLEIRLVPNVAECSARLAELQPCATVGAFKDCFTDYGQCQEVDRDACWFWIGDDGSCSAPYLGFERTPVGLQVLPPVPANCDDPGPRQRIPFMISTTDVFPLVPGDTVNGLVIEPGLTLDAGSLAVRRPRVSTLTDTECTSDADCTGDFKCATAGMPGAPRQCTRQNPVTFVPETIRADFEPGVNEDQQQLVGVLIENTAMLEGRLPTASGGLHDETGEKDLLTEPTRASDPTRIHREAIKTFLVNLASVADPLNTAATIFWYAGQVSAEARPLIKERELEDHFENDLSLGESLIDGMPNPVPKPANLWQAVLAMIDKDFGLAKYAEHEKFLFVFTDGPNEVWDPEATYEQVLQAAAQINLHIYIVHLDAAVDPTLIRDLPTYWAGNDNCQSDPGCMKAPACASDANCGSHEECRPAKIYSETAGGPVTETPVSYCLPAWDAEGHLGPIDQYSDLACRTGGSYMYVTRPEQLRPYWGALANAVNGQYSIEADFAALESSDFPDGWYRLSGVFLGVLGTRDLGHVLTAPLTPIDHDNRAILRAGK